MGYDFDSSEYAWKDLEVIMLGRPLVRILDIKYKVARENKEIYGRGSEPVAIQKGNKKYDGEIKIGQSELEALVRKSQQLYPLSDPTDLPAFNVTVAYEKNGVIITDVIIGVSLSEVEKGMKQGDSDMEVSLPFKALKINYNTTK